ncbi:MAG TPA: AAA family ATPase, partial [Methylomirabilota bacterium]|nr:AAA family ATPase [Methylomirabilota bacterium]
MLETVSTARQLRSFGLSLLASVLPAEDDSAEARFLRSHGFGGDAPDEHLDCCLANPPESDWRLLRLAEALGLNRIELVVTAIAAGVETDLMCGRAIAHLQAPLGGSRPTFGLLCAALRGLDREGDVVAAILTGAGASSGLLQIQNDGAPLAERSVSVPVPLCLALDRRDPAAERANWPGTILGRGGIRDIPLPPSILADAGRQARGLAGGAQTALALRSGSAAEAKAVACEIAEALGRRPCFIDADNSARAAAATSGLGPWLALQDALPVFCFELGPGERKALPGLPHYRGPRLAVCGPEGSLELGGETIPSWIIGVAPKAERIDLWRTALGQIPHDNGLAQLLASSHRHGSGRIAQLGRLARHQSRLDGRAEPQLQDVVAASWTAEGAGLEALAQPLPDPIPDEALVMTPGLRDELGRLLLRCRGREGLVDGLGASAAAKYRPGVRALFTGPSGTGKTLAAGWLATRLGLPLYRVDLAAVTSK